jgi:hypothetical protein
MKSANFGLTVSGSRFRGSLENSLGRDRGKRGSRDLSEIADTKPISA